jgi:heptosyltransferase-1
LPHRRYIVIHPFAAWSFRQWSPSHFIHLAHSILRGMDCDIVFVCSDEEEQSLEVLRREFRNETRVYFFASPSLSESAALIQGASAFIGNDSGPLHLAAVLGVPVIGLFGPAHPQLTGPTTSSGTYLYHRVECSPCSQIRCVRPEAPCIDLISPDEVLVALRRLWARLATKEVTPHG